MAVEKHFSEGVKCICHTVLKKEPNFKEQNIIWSRKSMWNKVFESFGHTGCFIFIVLYNAVFVLSE